MTLYFNNQGVNNEWEKIEFALSKITGERKNQAQKWADTAIKVFIHFQTELKKWREDNEDEPNEEQIQQFTNRPPFGSWKEMAGCIADFFITNESISNAIENLKRLKQGNRMVEDYWMDFCTWKDLTQYNEIALVGIF